MSVVINTNTQSIFAQRAIRRNTFDLQKNLEHLSTGYRVNRASDDAAGLSIGNKLETRILGFEKAKQNAADGISLIQTTEGAVGVIQENLQRVRELVVQGINGTYGTNEINALQREINERIKIIDDISSSAEFNGIELLSGNNFVTNGGVLSDTVLQTGSESGQTTTISFGSGIKAGTGININVDAEVSGTTLDYGEMIEGITQVGFALSELRISGATVDSLAVLDSRFAGAANVDIAAVAGTGNITLNDLDTIIDNVSRMRSELGAMQNALESKMIYMDVAVENAQASRSRIMDVDVAKESSMLVKNQIIQQSSAAMLSQANAYPQIALQLLQQG